jgi:hypothetical protein
VQANGLSFEWTILCELKSAILGNILPQTSHLNGPI